MLEITRRKNVHTCRLTHSRSSICKMMSFMTLYSHLFLMKQFGDEAGTASETGKCWARCPESFSTPDPVAMEIKPVHRNFSAVENTRAQTEAAS